MSEIGAAQSALGQRTARAALPLAAGLLAYGACALLAPAVVNGDGLGYLRGAAAGAPLPGHLLWLTLLRWLGNATGSLDALALLGPARQLCWLAAAGAAAGWCAAVQLLAGSRAAAVAALGMVGLYGFLEAGSDVETYAPALAAMGLSFYGAARRSGGGGAAWLAAAATAAALAALIHVENVLFVPVVALLAGRRRGQAAGQPRLHPMEIGAVALSALALVVAAYAVAARARGDDLPAALHWFGGASHGFRYPLGPASPLIALYGMARTLVFSPYPFAASWPWLLLQSALGGAALLGLWRLAAAGGGWRAAVPDGLGGAAALAWALPYGAVGVLFFASDSERWLFLLPAAWLVAGAGAARSPLRLRAGLALGAALLSLSLGLGLPRAHDAGRRQRADAVAALIGDGDLVVSPGHGWDEYVGFYHPRRLERFPMIYYCGALGGRQAMAAELRLRAERAHRQGQRIFWLRGDEPAQREGWKDLALFGISPGSVDSLLPGRRVVVAPGVERLDELSPPSG